MAEEACLLEVSFICGWDPRHAVSVRSGGTGRCNQREISPQITQPHAIKGFQSQKQHLEFTLEPTQLTEQRCNVYCSKGTHIFQFSQHYLPNEVREILVFAGPRDFLQILLHRSKKLLLDLEVIFFSISPFPQQHPIYTTLLYCLFASLLNNPRNSVYLQNLSHNLSLIHKSLCIIKLVSLTSGVSQCCCYFLIQLLTVISPLQTFQ